MLSDAKARAAKPREKEYKLGAGEGPYLLVRPNGRKFWKLKYRIGLKEKKLSLGSYPVVSLKKARMLTLDTKTWLAEGEDPAEKKRADKAALRKAQANSFQAIAAQWFESRVADKSAGYQRRTKITLNKYLLPYLGTRPLAEIKVSELRDVLEKPQSLGFIDSAHRARQVFGQVERFAILIDAAEHDISAGLKGALIKNNQRHYLAPTKP